jgi:hypothetical protein
MTLFGGLLVGTVVGLVLIPVLYVMVQTVRERTKARLFGASQPDGSDAGTRSLREERQQWPAQ